MTSVKQSVTGPIKPGLYRTNAQAVRHFVQRDPGLVRSSGLTSEGGYLYSNHRSYTAAVWCARELLDPVVLVNGSSSGLRQGWSHQEYTQAVRWACDERTEYRATPPEEGDRLFGMPWKPNTDPGATDGYVVTRNRVTECATLGFRVLPGVGWDVDEQTGLVKGVTLIDYQDDDSRSVSPDEVKTVVVPVGYTLHINEKRGSSLHRPGSILLRIDLGVYPELGERIAMQAGGREFPRLVFVLCAMDEGSYFGTVLERAAISVEDAFASLAPAEVESGRVTRFVRQGEWFFETAKMWPNRVYTVGFNQDIQSFGESVGLDWPVNDGNRHTIPEARYWDGELLVRGTVRHTNRWGSRGDHRPLKLEGWSRVYKNRCLASFSPEGRVD